MDGPIRDKVIYDTTTEVKNFNHQAGRPASSTFIRNSCVVKASFSRIPKPPSLPPTSMIILRNERNTGTYRVGIREGSFSYAGGGTTTERLINESGNGAEQTHRARAKVSEFNFGETLVEFNETANLVQKRLSDAFRLFHNIRRGNWKALEKQGIEFSKDVRSISSGSKRLASGYLEAQFGWRPILSDIHSGIEAYGRTISTKGDRVLTRSGNKYQKWLPNSEDPSRPRGGDFLDPDVPLEANATFGGVVSSPAAYELNRLGLANPALMAWNKLPFSFLVDWFLPISPILGGLTAGMGLTSTFSTITVRSMITTRGKTGPLASVVNTQQYTVNRAPAILIGRTPIDNKGVALRVGQIATAAALVRQVLMR